MTTKLPKKVKRKHYKATQIEVNERVEWLADQLRAKPIMTRTEMHRIMNHRYGLGWNNVDELYVRRARELIRKEADISPEEARRRGIGVLNSLIDHKDPNVRLKAETRLGAIFGYDAPKRTEIAGPQGAPVQVQISAVLPKLSRSRLQELALELPDSTNGEKTNGDPA